MDTSIFENKSKTPDDNDLTEALGKEYDFWKDIHDYVHLKYPSAMDEWTYSGPKHGWSFRIKDKKRVIIYLLPRDKFFKAAMIFGQKATDQVMDADISDDIKTMLNAAVVYVEGRGIRIDVRDEKGIRDIKKLIDIKLSKH